MAATLPPPAWSFGDDPRTADRLLELVLAGRKTAMASALRDYEDDARARARADADGPVEGDLLVATELDLVMPQRGVLSILLAIPGRRRRGSASLIQTLAAAQPPLVGELGH